MSILEKFLKYVSFETTSKEDSNETPSSPLEILLADELKKELIELGLSDVERDEYGYVYAHLDATKGRESEATIALLAHMDTSPSASGKNVKTNVFQYMGGSITLQNGTIIDETADLKTLIGETIITTDGNTLLGADDKAGMAEIMELIEFYVKNPNYSHPRLSICFTPDEEIGQGPDHIDMNKLNADFGYTLDGDLIGGIEYENFNAASLKMDFHGVNVHPGSAKGIMKNACLMVMDFMSMLPPDEIPAKTEGYEGFYHLNYMTGDECEAHINMIIRDHDKVKFEERKQKIYTVCALLKEKWGDSAIDMHLNDSYYNMKEKVQPYMFLIDYAKEAMLENNIQPLISPIRGGTDGARLSFMGLPCPNLSTGGMNYHSVRELVSLTQMEKMVEVLKSLLLKTFVK